MKYQIPKFAAVLAVMVMLLCSCGKTGNQSSEQPEVKQPLVLTAVVGNMPDTLKPADCAGDGSETILYHLYENLMRWENDGYGHAVLVPGQAESYTVETDYLGNATYTFTLRSDIFWSDGQAVSAYHFVSAWQRIADPAFQSPYRELMRCIAGYDAVQNSGDASLLKVSATDSRTLIVALSGSAPYFLEEVCASAYTMPIRTFVSAGEEDKILTNGPYVVKEFSAEELVLVKNEKYYGSGNVTVDELRFIPSEGVQADYEKFKSGVVDLTVALPASELDVRAQEENWRPEPVTSTYGFVFNTRIAPFDDSLIRTAFRLVIDEQAVIDALNNKTLRPAVGLIPYGVSDHGGKNDTEAASDEATSEIKPPLVNHNIYRDFRVHGNEIVTLDVSDDYAADCTYARTLLAEAGYADGAGFPQVEYLYIDTPENQAVAQVLQKLWKKELGVTVALRAVTGEEYEQLLHGDSEGNGEESVFQIAAMEFTAAVYDDAGDFLSQWHSSSAANCAGYSSAAFDILINCSRVATMASTYDAYLHDAEAILLEDAPVVALFYRGSGYAVADGLSGLYRAPNGVFFLANVTGRAN